MVNIIFLSEIDFNLTLQQNFFMFLTLNHKKLDIYATSRAFVQECYKLTNYLPPEERFGMISQIRRAALSVHLNIAEGASRRSENERRRYYEIARGSVIEIDAALDIAKDLSYLETRKIDILGKLLIQCFKMLSGMIEAKKEN